MTIAVREGVPEDLDAVPAIDPMTRSDPARLNRLRLGLAQREVHELIYFRRLAQKHADL